MNYNAVCNKKSIKGRIWDNTVLPAANKGGFLYPLESNQREWYLLGNIKRSCSENTSLFVVEIATKEK